jgi:hypothetical protein
MKSFYRALICIGFGATIAFKTKASILRTHFIEKLMKALCFSRNFVFVQIVLIFHNLSKDIFYYIDWDSMKARMWKNNKFGPFLQKIMLHPDKKTFWQRIFTLFY